MQGSNIDNLSIDPIIISNVSNSLDQLQGFKTKAHLVSDTIHAQLTDLIKTRHPAQSFTEKEMDVKIKDYLGGQSMDEFGNWIYYPWSGNLVHILPESDFIELRTNRNRDKITIDEQQLLYKKRIAVIGLSVGQSVALALAMERICGELIIADFDSLDLSNLNRIRTGVHNLGLPKTTIVAREIKEIDPYFKVTVYEDGATASNLPSILDKDNPVDILIDECDSMSMKVKMRILARSLGIPVIMDTSDRGQVDIERYDIDNNRPIFHGAINEEDLKSINFDDPQTKLRIMQSMIDFSTASPRAVQSFGQIGKTLKTWPQLASSVMLGGAVTADVCRRILLNESQESGKFFVEIDKLVP